MFYPVLIKPEPTHKHMNKRRSKSMQDYIEELLDIADELDDDSTEDYSDI